jgi:purine-nucleoside phosphorylase
MITDEWKKVDEIAAFLRERLGEPPRIVMVLGSGLGAAGADLRDGRRLEFSEIPNWPQSTVEGHAGRLLRGWLAGEEVVIQQGRVHLYEGYSPTAVVRPLRALLTWGADTVILTNAAGVVDASARPGELMAIEDHINLTGRSPLRGPNEDSRGPRFPDMTDIYDPGLRALALDRASGLGITLRTGVYAGMAGPSYETPAEVRMLAGIGANAVGMSTVLEAIAARHMGARIVGISCIANQAAASRGSRLSHEDVQLVGAKAADRLAQLLVSLVAAIAGR